MVWRIALNERADLDLEHVVAFLAQKNLAAAERLGLKLVETIFRRSICPIAAWRCGAGRVFGVCYIDHGT